MYNIQNFVTEDFLNQRRQYEEQENHREIENLFENYREALGLSSLSPASGFQATFYNKFPKNMSQQEIDFWKEHLPKVVKVKLENQYEAYQPINLDMWLKSYDNNPDPNALYIT